MNTTQQNKIGCPHVSGLSVSVKTLTCLFMVLAAASVSLAQDTWNGLGADANWSTDLNWTDGSNPGINFNEALTFGGTTQLNNTNNLTGGTVSGLTFDATAGAFILNGNSFTNAGGIANNSTNLQTINNGLSNNAVSIITLTAGGGDVTLNGNITGAGSVTTAGAGTLTLNGTNGYTGTTTIGAGTTIKAGSITALGANTGALTISSGGALDLNGNSITKGNFSANTATCIVTSTAPATLMVNYQNTAALYSGLNLAGTASLLLNGSSGSANPLGTLAIVTGTGSIGLTNQSSVIRLGNIAANLGTGGALLFAGKGQYENSAAITLAAGNSVVVMGTNNYWHASVNATVGATLNGSFLGNGDIALSQGFNAQYAIGGDMTGFTGTINLENEAQNSSTGIRFVNTTAPVAGSASARFTQSARAVNATTTGLNTIQWLGAGSRTIALGDLTSVGPIGTFVSNPRLQNGSAGTVATFVIGNLGSNSPYAGIIQNGSGITAITKVGTGTWMLSGANTYTGPTVVSNGVLALSAAAGTSSLVSNTISITVASGAKLDVSGMTTTFNLNTNALYGSGVVTGAVTTALGAKIYPGADGGAGTLSFSNALSMVVGAGFNLDVSTSAVSGNDQVIVGGALTLNSTTFTINALGGASPLAATDYVLVKASGISGSVNGAVNWIGTAPANSNNFSMTISNNTVLLHYTTGPSATPPTVMASIAPNTGVLRGQSVTVSAVVTPGSGTVTNVSVDLSSIGGSSAQLLTDSGDHTNYSLTATVGSMTAIGNNTLALKATDTTPLSTFVFPSFTVVASIETWDGGDLNDNWSSPSNWVSDLPPGLVGDTLIFSGTVRTSPVMNNSYGISGLTFDGSAGAFTIGTTGGALTLGGSGAVVENDSANLQTLNVPVVLSAAQTINTASGDIQIGGAVSGGAGFTKTGGFTLTMTNASSYSGSTVISAGSVVLAGNNSAVTGPTTLALLTSLQLQHPNALGGSALTMNNGSTLSLRADADSVFTNGNITINGDTTSAADTTAFNFDVNALNAATNKLLMLTNTFAFSQVTGNRGADLTTVNVTGGNGYSLGLNSVTLSFQGDSGKQAIFDVAPGLGLLISSISDGGQAQNIVFQDSGNATVSNIVQTASRTDSVTISGPGTVTLNGNSKHTGTTGTATDSFNLNGGQLNINSSKALRGDNAGGTFNANLIIAGGSLDNTSGGNITLTNPVTQNWNADFTFLGSNDLDMNNGAVTLSSSRSITVSNKTLAVRGGVGDLGGAYGITKEGPGKLLLTGANTYSGATFINNGTLVISTLHAGGGDFTVADGKTLAVTNAANAAGAAIANLTFGTSGPTTNYFNQVSSTTVPLINASGALTVNGTCVVDIATNTVLNTGYIYPLIKYGSFAGAGNFVLGSLPSSVTATVTNDASNLWIALKVTAGNGVNNAPTNIVVAVNNGQLVLSWPADHTGWHLQIQTNSLVSGLGTNWVTLPGSDLSNGYTNTINSANGSVFYRLVYP